MSLKPHTQALICSFNAINAVALVAVGSSLDEPVLLTAGAIVGAGGWILSACHWMAEFLDSDSSDRVG